MYNDDSDDSDLMLKVFPVDDNEDDLDFSIPPTSGQEYLKRVIREAKNCPDIVVANVSSSLIARRQCKPTRIQTCASLLPAPQGYASDLTWQKQQVFDFDEVRKKLLAHKSRAKSGVKGKHFIPLKENVNAWCALCFGRLDISQIGSDISESTDKEISSPLSAACGQFLSSDGGSPPLLSIVTFMDQPTVVRVLEYHVNWFEKIGFTLEQGRWFYALLACLEKPLDPEACALIRNLARHCACLRGTLESVTDSRLVALNLIICLVARYFDQLDLGDH